MSSHNSPSNGNDGLRQRAPKKIKANNYYCSVNNGGGNEIPNTPLLANSSVKCVGSSSAVRPTVNRDSEMIQQIFWRNKQSLDQLQPAQQPLLIPKMSPQQYQHIVQESQAKVSMDENRKVLNASIISGGATNVGRGANTTMNSMDNNTKFNNFPYYLSKATETLLVGSYFLHMQGKMLTNKTKAPCTGHRVMLLGPEGTDVYQETLAMSLAHYFQAKLLVFDCQLNLKDMASFGTWSPSSNQALKFELKRLGGSMFMPPQSPWFSHENSTNQSLKRDDRVVYTGIKNLDTTNNIASIGPTFGNRGSVISLVGPTHVGVKFDTSVSCGFNPQGQGFVCNVNELCLDLDGQVEPLIRPSKGSNGESNIIVFIKHAVNCMAEQEGCDRISPLINRLPHNVFLIGSHVQREFKGNFDATKEQVFQRALKTFSNVFYNKIIIEMPEDKTTFDQLKNQLDKDAQLLKVRENISRLCQALLRNNLECDAIEISVMKDLNLTDETAETAVKMAVGSDPHQLQIRNNSNMRLSRESIISGLNTLRASLSNQTNSRTFSKNIASENIAYENMVMGDLIRHDQIGVKFDDIGALDNVKEMLKKIVILPLQRPELFRKGLLRKPCRGILLFGPPGTGKTMLAKAVATEAGANFFNISSSSFSSKWYGDSEKYVKALFLLARKLAPSVVFLDEVDSIFGMRKESEHEATRRIKNEFMLNWDGLLTKDTERVLVLAATNRPFDLDEAAIRRMPCRCMVDLPDIANRSKILKVILAEEELSCDVDCNKIARMTTNFSGNDLDVLCRDAARIRLDDFLANEKGKSPEAEFRPLNKQDFLKARNKLSASVLSNSRNTAELHQWNELHCGGGGSRTPPNPAHFPPPGFPMRPPNMIVPKSE